MTDSDIMYPIRFVPVYKQVLWGGNNLEKILHRTLPETHQDPIGEAWDICDRAGVASVVEEGPLKGHTLRELVENFNQKLVGSSFRGGAFPLLVKIIDAGKRLSLQVHPDEKACAALGNSAQPKTEMWYIIHAEKGAKIFAGLRGDTTRRAFLETAGTAACEQSLQIFDSRPGDAYFINAGRVHAIGEGNLLLEIQQNSDTTYRISDWGRVGADGKPRTLHLAEAMQCIDYNDRTVPRIAGAVDTVNRNRKYPIIRQCPFFHVEDLRLADVWHDTTAPGTSFHLLTAISGTVRIGNNTVHTDLVPGRSCILPAVFGDYTITIPGGGNATVIKTTL